MRSARSFIATMSIAPSSTRLRPTFHASPTRMPYCSRVSGSVLGTSSTAICDPLRASKSASSCSSVARCSGVRVPVRSVTRACNGGTATSACAEASTQSSSTSTTCRGKRDTPRTASAALGGRRTRRRSKIHLRRTGDFALVFDREVRLRFEAEDHGRQVGRKGTDRDVVVLHRLDVTVARDRDAVLRALELRLQIAEVGVGLELRIVFGDDQQTRQCRRQLALRRDEALKRGRVVHQRGRRLDGADFGARFGDAEEHLLFLRGEALHRVHQIRHEVGAALVLVQHLRPGGVDLLVISLQGVVAATAEEQQGGEQSEPAKITHVTSRDDGASANYTRAGRRDSYGAPNRPHRRSTTVGLPKTAL